MRFISKTFHAYLDYPVALALIGLPVLLGLGPVAAMLSVATGVAALILTALTDHRTGLLRVLPFSLHLAVDGLVGALFVMAPVIFGFHGLDAAYVLTMGVAVLLVVASHRPENALANA
ncbi:MAG: hypothetical protein AAF390_17860 [Pseudomonadota bacterium]